MNNLTLKGNLGADPELRNVGAKGTSVANFNIAHSVYKGKDADNKAKYETFWIKVTCWGYLADRVTSSLAKGDTVVVMGRLEVRNYTDKDGVKRTSTECVAEEVVKTQKMVNGEAGQGAGGGENMFDKSDFSNEEFPTE